jgi:hypothetical protein
MAELTPLPDSRDPLLDLLDDHALDLDCIRASFEFLPERERAVMTLRYGEPPLTIHKTMRKLGLSKSQIETSSTARARYSAPTSSTPKTPRPTPTPPSAGQMDRWDIKFC